MTTAAAAIAAPFVLRGRYRVFAQSPTTYSARCLKLVSESIVIDMLSPLSLGPAGRKWMADPDSFTAADLQRFRDSGITSFHIAVGTGGPEVYDRTIDVQIRRLRLKLEEDPAHPRFIVTERGSGYMLDCDVETLY